jgi:protein-L-isoaspartate(D-aspartate) O-methyltransferase
VSVLALLGLAAIVLGLFGEGWGVWHSGASQAGSEPSPEPVPAADSHAPLEPKAQEAEPAGFTEARRRMVERQLRARDITDARVLSVMGRVPRHRFVAREMDAEAYDDHPLPIGHAQTISQPYIVALMTQLAKPSAGCRTLDVGTGSGYQAAILAELCKEVYSIEIVPPLAEEARKRLTELGYKNITVRAGDGYRGWPEHAPFDVILVAASPDHVPQPLIDQLAPGGRLVLPVGGYPQQLTVIEKQKDGSVRRKSVAPVMFVPMTGEAQQRKEDPRNGPAEK